MNLTGLQLSSNPVFVRLCGQNRWIPPVFVFVLMPIVQSIPTTLLIIPHLRSPIPGHPLVRTMLAGWLIVLTFPAIIAVTAMLIVAIDARSKEYQLLTLTNISAGRRVNGYVVGVLYRMRFFLLLLAVIAPWLASGMAIVRLVRQAFTYLAICPSNDVRCSPYIDFGISPASAALEAVLVHLMIWGLSLLAVNAGVMFGLKWRHNLNIAPLVAVCVLLLDGIVIYGWTREKWVRGGPGIVGIQPLQIGICVGIIMFILWIYQLAKRWA